MANLYIIAGPNGAGKTTASFTMLPEVLNCREFVNADEIARGLSPFNPESVAIEAGRLMLTRIKELLSTRIDFAIETTLATRSYASLVRRAHERGYTITLVYFRLESPSLAIERVKQRVAMGGHNIPADTIARRYKASIRNLFELYMDIVENWLIFDNSNSPTELIAEKTQDRTTILNERIYKVMQQ